MNLYKDTVKLEVDHAGGKHQYLVSKLLPTGVWTEPVPKEGATKYLEVIPKYLTQWSANVASETWLNALKEGLTKNKWAETYDEARYKHRDLSDAGKSKGTSLHDLVEKWLKGEETIKVDDGVGALLSQFKAWWTESGWKCLEAEKPCYSLSMDFCGKADILAETPAGKIILADVKSTKSGVYIENFYQLGAYALAILEEGTIKQIDDLAILNPNTNMPILASHFNMSVEDAIRSFAYCKVLKDDIDKWSLKSKGVI